MTNFATEIKKCVKQKLTLTPLRDLKTKKMTNFATEIKKCVKQNQ